jgi:hypothetical protein
VTSPVSKLVCRRYIKAYPNTGKCICFNFLVQLAVFLQVHILANMSKSCILGGELYFSTLRLKLSIRVSANMFLGKVLGTTLVNK